MVDLISSLPHEIICYVLSFLPSQQVFATSVLSKSWNLLWRSVPSLDFDTDIEDFRHLNHQKIFNAVYSSVYSFLVGRGDKPFYRIRLRCYPSIDITESIKTQIRTAVSGSDRVEILDLKCDWDIVIPSMVFSFKTLVELKLEDITIEDMSFVDLSLLKILHLKCIISPIEIDVSQLLFFSGCPNLEVLEVFEVWHLDCETKRKFIRLSKLVRVSTDEPLLPLEIFKDVEVLKFYYVMHVRFITFYLEREKSSTSIESDPEVGFGLGSAQSLSQASKSCHLDS
ncbi:hypothetical protein V8G54_013570 [Vigna mungo]|uniref:F-box domain-containing protein n=1 Tax=Vigna mungo TaxID=3915 RepID=A0AAQ3NTY3_VIGMU